MLFAAMQESAMALRVVSGGAALWSLSRQSGRPTGGFVSPRPGVLRFRSLQTRVPQNHANFGPGRQALSCSARRELLVSCDGAPEVLVFLAGDQAKIFQLLKELLGF